MKTLASKNRDRRRAITEHTNKARQTRRSVRRHIHAFAEIKRKGTRVRYGCVTCPAQSEWDRLAGAVTGDPITVATGKTLRRRVARHFGIPKKVLKGVEGEHHMRAVAAEFKYGLTGKLVDQIDALNPAHRINVPKQQPAQEHPDYTKMTKEALYALGKQRGLKVTTKMRKAELIEVLSNGATA